MTEFSEGIIMGTGRIKELWSKLKKKRLSMLLGCAVIYSAVIFVILPVYESLIPEIIKMEGKLYAGERISEPAYGVIFWGNNFSGVDTVYINGTENTACQIIDSSSHRIVVDIPRDVYYGKEAFDIQVAKRIGGVYVCKAKKYTINVSENTQKVPEIIELSSDVIYREQEPRSLTVTLGNMEESEIYVNGTRTASVAYPDNNVEISITSDMYQGRESIEIMPVTDIGGGQKLYGDAVVLKVEDVETVKYEHSCELAEKNTIILQAAGMWQGNKGTKCMEAFLEYYGKGSRAFEVDIAVTSDGVLAGYSDWLEQNHGEVLLEEYQKNNLPKSFEELCDIYEGQTPLRWEDMLGCLIMDPELYFVVDVKYDNEEAIEYIFGRMVEEARAQGAEAALERVAIQFGSPDMYDKVMEVYPFSTVIYALPQSAENMEEVLEFIENSNVRMITLQQGSAWDQNAFLQELLQDDCYVYIHTVNRILKVAEYMERGYSGVYSDSITAEQLTDAERIAEEQEENKQFLINYLQEIKNEDYLVLMSVQDEATAMVDDDIARALEELGVSKDYRFAYHQSYLGIMSGGNMIYEAFSDELLEYEHVEGKNVFQMKSAGGRVEAVSEITVNGEKNDIYERGLHITVFNKKLGIVQDRIVFDLYRDLGHMNY